MHTAAAPSLPDPGSDPGSDDPESSGRGSKPRSGAIRVGGLTPLSATDFPGELAAVVFCQGCPWRCRYCHNPHLLPARGVDTIDWADVVVFLARRRGLLDAVVFSGGEPLAQTRLRDAILEVRSMGYRIGLHTGGAYPDRFAAVLPLVDWVGFDVKAPFGDYAGITGAEGSGEPAATSLEMMLASGVDCEVRTTVHPHLLGPDALEGLALDLANRGVRRYVLQAFRPTGCVERTLADAVTGEALPQLLTDAVAPLFASLGVRRS